MNWAGNQNTYCFTELSSSRVIYGFRYSLIQLASCPISQRFLLILLMHCFTTRLGLPGTVEMAVIFSHYCLLISHCPERETDVLSENWDRRAKILSSQTPGKVSVCILGPDWATCSCLDQSLWKQHLNHYDIINIVPEAPNDMPGYTSFPAGQRNESVSLKFKPFCF